jgi:ABC-2 type transport system ATP-binding protein
MQTAENPNAAITVDRLSKTYPVPFLRLKKLLRKKFKPPVEALRQVSFTIHEAEIFGLIGPNGAGKTTLTKIIATLVQPSEGSVTVKDHDTVQSDETVRRHVGLSGAEERSFYWRLTAEQNLLFFARLHGLSGRAARSRIAELFELFEIQEFARRRFAELSTGNKQRLSIARAMLANPPILLLDEPTRSLDPIAANRTRALIKSLAHSGITIFLTSHNLPEVEELCERVAIISHGEIKAIDAPRNLRTAHTEEERVTVTFSGLSPADAEEALTRSYARELYVIEGGAGATESVARFTRVINDDLLDNCLRILQQSGAVIRSVESEKATLLDVLERYDLQDEQLNRVPD